MYMGIRGIIISETIEHKHKVLKYLLFLSVCYNWTKSWPNIGTVYWLSVCAERDILKYKKSRV